jgi:hypothetical protein
LPGGFVSFGDGENRPGYVEPFTRTLKEAGFALAPSVGHKDLIGEVANPKLWLFHFASSLAVSGAGIHRPFILSK